MLQLFFYRKNYIDAYRKFPRYVWWDSTENITKLFEWIFQQFFIHYFWKILSKIEKEKKMLELQYKKNNAPLEYGKIIKKINGYNLKFDLSKKVREV